MLLAILDFAKGRDPESWVWVKRFHHQYIPDQILYEKDGLTETEIKDLTRLGYLPKEKNYGYGNMQAVQFDKLRKCCLLLMIIGESVWQFLSGLVNS